MKNTSNNGALTHNQPVASNQSICNRFKPFDINNCTLRKNRIDIWQYPLHTSWSGAKDILNEAERERAAKFYFTKHQRRFTIAHATLRIILSRYLPDKNPNELEFNENKYGKPELTTNALQFNLSHSGNLALLAVGQYYPLGIDLELFSKRPCIEIGTSMFSETEATALKKVDERLQTLTFFRIWAQKEAFIKACGLGLSYPTKKFDVPHLGSINSKIVDSLHNSTEWQMTSFMPTLACCGAICHNPAVDEVRYTVLGNSLELT
jgi:4'-phosphopantetheinyl transferase